jgi:hypothetical protein
VWHPTFIQPHVLTSYPMTMSNSDKSHDYRTLCCFQTLTSDLGYGYHVALPHTGPFLYSFLEQGAVRLYLDRSKVRCQTLKIRHLHMVMQFVTATGHHMV